MHGRPLHGAIFGFIMEFIFKTYKEAQTKAVIL
jgi:hypothetical protein